jgi:hypothetical protein
MLSHRFTFPIIAVVLSAPLASAEPIDLSAKWSIGQTTTYRITQQNQNKMSGMPGMGDIEMGQTQVSTIRFSPKEAAEDGATTVEAVFDAIRLEVQDPMKPKRSYDSANPDPADTTNSLAKLVNAVIGQPITVVFAPDGSVKSIDGVKAIGEKMGGGPGAAAFSEQSITKLLEITFRHLPGKSVEVGDSWEQVIETPLQSVGTMKGVGQATLTSVEAGIATIDTTTAITLEPPAPGQPANPMMKKMTVTDASGHSTTTFDTARGLVRRVEGKVTMPMETTVKGPDGSDSTISLLVNSSTTSELLETK